MFLRATVRRLIPVALVAALLGAASPTFALCQDARWVSRLYQNLLGRQARQDEVNYWLSALTTGMKRLDLVRRMMASREYHRWTVDCVFRSRLGRRADESALRFFGDGYLGTAGGNLEGLDQLVLNSQERYLRYKPSTPLTFVQMLSFELTGTVSPQSGDHAALLERGFPKGSIVRYFVKLPESQAIRLYLPYMVHLARFPRPDEIMFWLDQLQSHDFEYVISRIASSDECYGRP